MLLTVFKPVTYVFYIWWKQSYPLNGLFLLLCDLDVISVWSSLCLCCLCFSSQRLIKHLHKSLLVLRDLLWTELNTEHMIGRGLVAKDGQLRAPITCRSWGLSRPSCCSRAGRSAGFCWMIWRICWNCGWFLRNSRGLAVVGGAWEGMAPVYSIERAVQECVPGPNKATSGPESRLSISANWQLLKCNTCIVLIRYFNLFTYFEVINEAKTGVSCPQFLFNLSSTLPRRSRSSKTCMVCDVCFIQINGSLSHPKNWMKVMAEKYFKYFVIQN